MEPLTIDELKALKVGDWVWVTTADRKYGAYARVCEKFDEDNFRVETIESYFVDSYSDYGTKWLAYKNKEQAEAKGELLELPCKVGDTVYYIATHYDKDGLKYDEVRETKFHISDFEDMGYMHFLTKEAAEARLKELQEQKK